MSELLSFTYELPSYKESDVKQSLIPQISWWNSGFNEAAATCGLYAIDLLAMPDNSDLAIGDAHWSRRGSKIHVGIGNAYWTVDVQEIGSMCGLSHD